MGPALGGWLGVGRGEPCSIRECKGFWRVRGQPRDRGSPGGVSGLELPVAPTLLSPQQAHIPNSIMTILEASGKQEPEAKEPPAGPLEEVRVCSPGPSTQSSHLHPFRRLLLKGGGGGGTAAPYSQSCCLPQVAPLSPFPPSSESRLGPNPPPIPELRCVPPHPQDDLEPLALAPAPAPRPPQDLIGLRLAQEKALKRQLEEEQKLKPGVVAAPPSSSSSSSSARPGPPQGTPQPEEAMDFREEGPECETPAIFISMDDDSGLTEAALLDSSLEGPLPKVGMTTAERRRRTPGPGVKCVSGAHTRVTGRVQPEQKLGGETSYL